MDGYQLKCLMVQIFGVDIDSIRYCAPEAMSSKFHLIPKEKRIEVIVLYENCDGFKKRITGEIQDDWLTKENFEDIAEKCIKILRLINLETNLHDWQLLLIKKFEEMI